MISFVNYKQIYNYLFLYLYLMFYACDVRFDMMENLKKFLVFEVN